MGSLAGHMGRLLIVLLLIMCLQCNCGSRRLLAKLSEQSKVFQLLQLVSLLQLSELSRLFQTIGITAGITCVN